MLLKSFLGPLLCRDRVVFEPGATDIALIRESVLVLSHHNYPCDKKLVIALPGEDLIFCNVQHWLEHSAGDCLLSASTLHRNKR